MDKNLRIKTGSCTRLLKEVKAYQAEIIENKAKLQALKDNGEHFSQQEKVLQESEIVLPDSVKRLTKARDDLEDYLNDNPSLTSEEASAIISEIDSYLQASGLIEDRPYR